MIRVEKVRTKEQLDAIFEIRRRVFVVEQEVDPSEEYDDDDERCSHFIAYTDNIPAGTARWRFKDKGVIKLERFAVDAERRGSGVGSALVRAVLDDLPAANKVMLHAQLHAIPFYEKHGFEIYGEEFEEAGIRHYAMKIK